VVLTVILTIVGSNIGLFGLTQRLANFTFVLWILLVGLRLRSVAQGALAQQPSRVR
jgi:polyferredoxin